MKANVSKAEEEESKTISYYNAHASEFISNTIAVVMDGQRAAFLDHVPQGGHILDAGCGSGRDSKAFISMGYKVTAIDASPKMIEYAKEYTGQECFVLRLQDIDFVDRFDGIWACASLLHMPKQQILLVLRKLASALKKGGACYISMQEGEGERVLQDGRYFAYYTLGGFMDLVREVCCLQEIRTWKSDDALSRKGVKPWLNILLKKT